MDHQETLLYMVFMQHMRYQDWLRGILISGLRICLNQEKIKFTKDKEIILCQNRNEIFSFKNIQAKHSLNGPS